MKKDDKQQRSGQPHDSLDYSLDRLRDLYINFKDLSSRCMIEIGAKDKTDKRVFYFKPESFLLDEPEKQRVYRDKLMKKVTTLPNPEPIQYMGDDLHKQILEAIQDKADPTICKKQLASFYKRRQYYFQHKKYKLLLRWAHHAIASENLDRVGIEATQKYAKWEMDMENAIKRFERLDFEDGYDTAKNKTFKRPNTKAKEGGSLYVENTDLEPMSVIRADDVETYLRTVTYDQKINRLMTKYLARLKWLPLHRRFEIFNDATESYFKIKEANVKNQEKLLEKIHSKGTAIIPHDHYEQLDEFKRIMGSYYIQDYQSKLEARQDKILASHRADHQLAPTMIANILELKVQIVDKSIEYGIYGDIELDQGYSFAYQITIFFPSYFQKQIIQSQFSLYDAFAGEESDMNTVQKRNLINMVKIDTNIFKDISTTPHNVPSQEFLNTDPSFQNLKVTRLKSSTYWIDYVCVYPKVPAHIQKQAAYLSTDNPIDSLLRSALNFLDVNDLATVNKILEETARLHQQQQKELAAEEKLSKSKTGKDEKDGKGNMNSVALNLRVHFQSAIKGEMGKDNLAKSSSNITNQSLKYLPQHLINAFYNLRHMKARDYKIKLLYCLNYFRAIQKRMALDLKEFGTRERIYGDQVQPYAAPSEASRQAQINVNTQFTKTLKEQQKLNNISEKLNKSHMGDTASHMGDGANISVVSGADRQASLLKHAEMSEQQEKIFSTIPDVEGEPDETTQANIKLYDMKQFKYKGKFCNKIYSTCPVLPRFHATFGEPVEFQPLNVEMERQGGQQHISDEGARLLGRVDHFEISKETREVWVKDDFGIYVMQECAMQDMRDLEEELLKIGSFYIGKHEHLVNTECEKAYPHVDRITLLEDLLDKELDFQFEKVQIVQAYMETYEHISDPLEQQRLMQVVVDLMALRPRLNLSATYFMDSYDVEKLAMSKHTSLMKTMILNQMRYEKQENKKQQAFHDLSMRLTQEHQKGKWKYADAEDFFNELKRRREQQRQGSSALYAGQSGQDSIIGGRGQSNLSVPNQPDRQHLEKAGDQRAQASELSATQKFMKNQVDKQHASKYNHYDQQQQPQQPVVEEKNSQAANSHKDHEGGFAAVLGLPQITVETLYQQYKEKDEVILELMNEQANYIKMYEGFPDFLIEMQGLQSSKLSNYKFSDWSSPINVLDFYESLGFASRFYATVQSVVSEIQEVHKPHNYSFLAMMELKVIERAEVEYQKVKAFFDGDLLEYKGQQYIEDESIVGNSEKLVFHIQDMVSNLNKATKPTINPFIIGKLDIDTIAHFDFVSLGKDQNQYLFKDDGPLKVADDFDMQVKIAEQNAKATTQAQSRYFSQLKEFMRKVNTPPMLHLYCNSVEMLRVRQELITCMSESMILSEIYDSQGKLVNRPNFKPFFADQVKFDNYLIDSTKVNYVDDGPAATFELDLAVKEFDQVLKSNVNFRHPDAVKMLLCTSGLEELRGILHYQLMHKQLLIIAVRFNQVMLDTHQRALCELELARKSLSLPNSVIRIQNLFCKTGDGFSSEQVVKEKAKYMNNLSNNAANNFYQITAKKAKCRNTISKKFSTQLQTVATQHRKVESCLRIMRAYKVRLLHIYCYEVMRDAYFDCLKIQAISTCQRLRQMSQVFSIDESVVGVMNYPHGREEAQVFKYENHEFFENFFCTYNPEYQQELNPKSNFGGSSMPPSQQQQKIQSINPVKMEIVDYQTIPSTITLVKLDALSHEESQALADSLPNLLDPPPVQKKHDDIIPGEKEDIQNEEQEKIIKEVLPQIEFCDPEYPLFQEKDRTNLRMNDFKQSFDYSNTQFGQIYTYYAMLERIMKFDLSLNKMKGNLIDALNLEEAISSGMPFWGIDPEAAIHKKRQQESIYANTPKMSEIVLEKLVTEKRTKVNLAEDVVNLSNGISQIMSRCQQMYDQINSQKTSTVYDPIQRINEFLITHSEFKFYHLIHVIERLLDTYYLKGAAKEVKFLTDLHKALTKKDHIKVSYKFNAFHVNGAYTRPEQISIDSTNYFGYYGNQEEEAGFFSCVQPCINEKALSPPQISLFEGIYGTSIYKTTQYAGQMPHSPGVYPALDTAFINFSDQERRYINSTIHSVKILVIDFLDNIHKEKVSHEGFEEQVSLEQLRKSSKFLSDLIKARQLKVALMQWIAESTLPIDPEVYNQVFQQYKNDIFWKIMNKKDSLPPIGGASKAEEAKAAQASANKKAENSMVQNQQLTMMQAQVLVEQVQTCKAEIFVLQNELQRNIVNAAIQVIESESAALANCFNLVATPVASHIHPFQQFASTLYSRVDPNSHLDIVTKLSEVQRFITKLNNRGTEVETLTSGPGMVFTIKDFNECVQILCRGLIKYSEREMRSRSENFAKKEAHYVNLLYVKDRQIENLQARITQTQENLDKLINSKMYEKGNSLIYELDNVNRQLRLFKDHVYMMEKEVKHNVKSDFQEFLRKQRDNLETAVDKFKEYKASVSLRVSEDVAVQQQQISQAIAKKAEEYKNKEFGQEDWIQYKKAAAQVAAGGGAQMAPSAPRNNSSGMLGKNKKHIGGYYEEIENMTEIEARQELAEMWTEMRKLHVFQKTKEILTKDKYEREIFVLKKQLTSNACLWEQLAESDKREKVLKQELLYTQQSLAASEKVIDKLKEDLRKSESDRIRLNQYKTSKAQRLDELEGKVRKFEVMDNINLEKLIDALGSKEKQIQKLKEIERSFTDRVDLVERKKDGEIRDVKNSYFRELGMKKEVMERLEGLRMELRLLEKNEGSMTEVWKSKCKELVDICNKLKVENDSLRTKIQQIAMNLSSYGGVGGQVIDNESQYQQTSQRQNEQQSNNAGFQLPKLMNNGQNRLANNILGGKFGGQAATMPHTRQTSISKVLDSNPLMSPGFGYDNSTAPGSRQKDPASAQKTQRFPKEQSSFGKSFGLINSNALSASKGSNQVFGVLGQQAQMTKGYQSMKGTMAANTPQDTGSAVKTSGKHYSFKPDDVQQTSLDGGHASTNYNMGNDGSTMSPHPQ